MQFHRKGNYHNNLSKPSPISQQLAHPEIDVMTRTTVIRVAGLLKRIVRFDYLPTPLIA